MKKELYFCDVCGKEVDSGSLKPIRLSDGSETYSPVECCKDCYDEFEKSFVELALFLGLKTQVNCSFRRKYIRDVSCQCQEN